MAKYIPYQYERNSKYKFFPLINNCIYLHFRCNDELQT